MSWQKKDNKDSVWYLSFLFNKIVNKRVSLSSIFLQCFVMKHWEMFAVYVFAHSLGSAACSGSPHWWLSLITLLINCLSISYQSLTKHLVICAYRATAPPVYKPAAKGCKEVSASLSIKRPHSLSLTVYKLYLCLWTCRSLSAGLKLHFLLFVRYTWYLISSLGSSAV